MCQYPGQGQNSYVEADDTPYANADVEGYCAGGYTCNVDQGTTFGDEELEYNWSPHFDAFGNPKQLCGKYLNGELT